MDNLEQLEIELQQAKEKLSRLKTSLDYAAKTKGQGGGSVSRFLYAKCDYGEQQDKVQNIEKRIAKLKELLSLQMALQASERILAKAEEDNAKYKEELEKIKHIKDWKDIPFG